MKQTDAAFEVSNKNAVVKQILEKLTILPEIITYCTKSSK